MMCVCRKKSCFTGSFLVLWLAATLLAQAGPVEINFGGDLTFGPTSLLEIELAGNSIGPPTEYDRLIVGGTATLGGTLDTLLINGFQDMISASDQFTVIEAGTLTGQFTNIAPGGRLAIEEFGGEITVNYGATSPFDPHHVVLSDFAYVPLVATWIAGTSQWSTAANWDINQVPDNRPLQYAAIVPTGIAIVDSPIEVRALTVPAGGTVHVDNHLTVTEDTMFTGGAVDVAADATLRRARPA